MTAEDRRDGPVWFTSTPPDWRLLKFSWVVDIAEGQIDPEDATHSDRTLIAPNHIESGTGRLLARETASEQGAISGKYPCRRGDVLYSKIRPALRKATIAEEDCLCSADMYPLRPRGLLASRYLLYLIVSKPFTEWAVLESDRVAMPKINRESLNDLRIPVPPVQLQERLVAFLDPRITILDELVAAKQRLLDILTEKRKAIIATAVTRGLDRNARMAPTGVEWTPEAPSHWRPSRIGRLFRQSKLLGYPDLTVLSVYRDYGVIERSSRDDNSNVLPDDLTKYQLVEAGDLVVNKMKAWQGSLGISELCGITSPDYIVFRPSHSELPAYLHFMLRTPQLTTVYLSNSNGIRTNQWRIEPDRFLNIAVMLPSLDEQRAIVAHITHETAKIDAVRAATERTIALLKERRAALIAAAVTGQLDLEAAA